MRLKERLGNTGVRGNATGVDVLRFLQAVQYNSGFDATGVFSPAPYSLCPVLQDLVHRGNVKDLARPSGHGSGTVLA